MLRACIVFFCATILGPAARANVIGIDDRKPISEVYQALGLDTVDMLRIRQTTGFVYCPGTKYGNGLRTSGAAVHDNQVIVTNAHSFVDEQGRKREPLSECYFTSQGVVPEVVRFDFTPGNFEMTERWDAANDYAVVRLKQPLVYARAFPVADPRDIREGRELILISAKPRAQIPFSGLEPVAQICTVMQVFGANLYHNRDDVFHGDCDITPGSSGSLGLMLINGRLRAFSTASGGGDYENDGQPYNPAIRSYSFHTLFTGKVLAAIQRLANRRIDVVRP